MKLSEKQIKAIVTGMTTDVMTANLWEKEKMKRIYFNKKTGSQKTYGYVDCNDFENSNFGSGNLRECIEKSMTM